MTEKIAMQGTEAPVMTKITLPYPKFENLDVIPWKPYVMEGVEYKLMSVNNRTGGFTCLLRVAPNTTAPVHHHLGAIELIVLSGDIYYDKSDVGVTGAYMFEPAGDIHQPKSENGCVLFCVFDGPIAGLTDDGSVGGIIDGKFMLDLAKKDGIAANVHC